jgi:hypothetical protein
MKTGDVCSKTPRPEDKIEGNKKYYFNVVGKAFLNENGNVNVKLFATPINWNGELIIFFEEEK